MREPTSALRGELIFVKLGGSLITDKRQQSTARQDIIEQLARECSHALKADPDLRLLLGHGSGSFGHWEANRYGTRNGVTSEEAWHGFARVSAAALQLNRLVISSFIDAGVPLLSLQPSASALARNGTLVALALEPIRRALASRLVPLVFGDVAFDEVIGGTILSTEALFVYLAKIFRPSHILLLGNASGVLDGNREVIPVITPETFPQVQEHVRHSGYTDVTGGMADKVHHMVDLVQRMPWLHVRITTGAEPGNLERALLDPQAYEGGTLICASSPGT